MARVEEYGVEPIPAALRTVGWRDLFAINFTFFLNPVMYVLGALAVAVGGLPLWWAVAAMVLGQALAFSLYPFCFIEMDGYHVLVDVLGVPTLKHDALAYVKGLLTGASRMRLGREEGLWLGYVVLSTLSVSAFIAFNVWIIASATR